MNWHRIAFLLLFINILVPFSLNSYPYSKDHHHKWCSVEYDLMDLGPATNMTAKQLSRHAIPISFAPRINNKGQIIYNDISGGYLIEADGRSKRIKYKNSFACLHALSDDGTILASYNDVYGNIRWLCSYESLCRYSYPITLPVEIKGFKVFLQDINSKGMLAGMMFDGKDTFAIAISKGHEIHRLCKGSSWGVSEQGYFVANSLETKENAPYVWHPKAGTLVLSDFCGLKKPNSDEIIYMDMWMRYDDSVLGSFVYRNKPKYLYTFHWYPIENKFEIMDIKGMRISDLNGKGTMVGSLNGKAVICKKGATPRDLNNYIDYPQAQWWKLVEATSINDMGQILGYGYSQDELHIFLLNPKNSALKYYRRGNIDVEKIYFPFP